MAATAYEFLLERNDRLATALRDDPDLANFVQATLEHLIDRAEARGIPVEDLVIELPQIVAEGRGYLLRARIR